MADPSSRPCRNPDGSYSEDFVQQLLKMIESKNEQLSNKELTQPLKIQQLGRIPSHRVFLHIRTQLAIMILTMNLLIPLIHLTRNLLQPKVPAQAKK
jgi:hypothetical protein